MANGSDERIASDCERCSRVAAFHDGELSPGERQDIESHLETCEVCRAELDSLRRLSAIFAEDGQSTSLAAVARIHGAVDSVAAGDYFRTARLLIGLAASLLIIGLVWLWQAPGARPKHSGGIARTEPPPAWQELAMRPRAYTPPHYAEPEPEDRSGYAEARIIHYMLENLPPGANHEHP